MSMRGVVTILCFIAGCFGAPRGLAIAGQVGEPTARIVGRLSVDTTHVAEPLQLELTVTATAGCQVKFPPIGTKLGDFEVVDQIDHFDIPSSKNVDQRNWTRELTLETLTTGELEIPSLEVQVLGPKGSQILRTDRLPIRVLSVLKEGEQPDAFRDIETVVDMAEPAVRSQRWWWLLGVVICSIATVSVFAVILRRRSQVSPAAWAIGEIEQLEQSAATQSDGSLALSQRLTAIIREYLQLQFQVSAPVKTTEELLSIIEAEKVMPAAEAACLSRLFGTADQVKFAGLKLGVAELAGLVREATGWIQRTSTDGAKLSVPAEAKETG